TPSPLASRAGSLPLAEARLLPPSRREQDFSRSPRRDAFPPPVESRISPARRGATPSPLAPREQDLSRPCGETSCSRRRVRSVSTGVTLGRQLPARPLRPPAPAP